MRVGSTRVSPLVLLFTPPRAKSICRCFTSKTLTLTLPLIMPKTLDEPDVGISCFVSSLPGFFGILKQRYSDFIVNEVDKNGEVVHLTSFDLPSNGTDNNKEEGEPCSNNKDYSKEIESFQNLCGDSDSQALKGLLDKISSGLTQDNQDITPIILSPDSDKSHRSEVHNFFKRSFNFFITDTIDGVEDQSKCIRVRFNSGKNENENRGKKNFDKRGKKRKDFERNNGGKFDSRGSDDWSEENGKFVRFHLFKENKDTQEALGVIGKMLGVQPRSFGFAGTKDKRAVSTQQVTIFKVHPKRLAALNSRLFGIKIGNFCYVKEGLNLGQLNGNRFTLILRGVTGASEEIIRTSADALGKNGFINYFGLQRFGSGSIATHLIGAALLRGEWAGAVNLILDPREGERENIKEMREKYKENGDIDKMLRNLPRHLVAERSILLCLKKCPGNYLQALKAIPRTLRMMYVHSYQSYLWNHAASMRVQKYGIEQVVVGDLVYSKDSPIDESSIIINNLDNENNDNNNNNDNNDDAFVSDVSCDIIPEEKVPVVKVVDSEDITKGIYTFEDVVLPLPGSRVIFPDNEVASVYHEMAKKDDISLTEAAHGVKEFSITNMTGGYRRVFQRPIDYIWDTMKYSEDTETLAETDLDIMNNKTGENAKKDELVKNDSVANKLALKLGFTLPASAYATMLVRELLKSSSLIASQKINP